MVGGGQTTVICGQELATDCGSSQLRQANKRQRQTGGGKAEAPKVPPPQPPNSEYYCHKGNGLAGPKAPLPVGGAPKYGACDSGGGELDAKQPEVQSCLERLAARVPGLGIMLSLCASIFLGSAGMLVKMTQSVHGIQVAVFRAIIQLAIYGLIIQLRGLAWCPKRGEWLPVMGRASLGAASITCSYFALKLIPLGDATVIRFSLPIWTLIVSYLVLNESCSLLKVAAVVVSISGVVLIAKPDTCVYACHLLWHSAGLESDDQFSLHSNEYQQTVAATGQDQIIAAPGEVQILLEPAAAGLIGRQLQGSLLALSSSVCLAMSLIALRLCNKTPAEITIVWLSIYSVVIGTITLICLSEWRMPNNWTDVIYIVLNGLCGAIGQWFITSALKIEQSGVISLARTFDIEVAFLYSAFLLKEQIRATSLVGSFLVSFGVIAVVAPKWLASRASKVDSSPDGGGGGDGDGDGIAKKADFECKSVAVGGAGADDGDEPPAKSLQLTKSVC